MTPRQVTRVSAYGLILLESRILLCRISNHLPLDAGFWTLPGGGIDFGEDPADAMVREVHEETGLIVRPLAIAGIDSTSGKPSANFTGSGSSIAPRLLAAPYATKWTARPICAPGGRLRRREGCPSSTWYLPDWSWHFLKNRDSRREDFMSTQQGVAV